LVAAAGSTSQVCGRPSSRSGNAPMRLATIGSPALIAAVIVKL
jgi:hypothetical protein